VRATLAGSRPASAVNWRSRAIPARYRGSVSSRCLLLLPIGYHASPNRAARSAFAANPDRRMRLLHRLGLEVDPGVFDPVPLEMRDLRSPQGAEGAQIFVGNPAARGKRGPDDCIKFRLQPAGADPDDEAPAG
jgi:hypothetical protein